MVCLNGLDNPRAKCGPNVFNKGHFVMELLDAGVPVIRKYGEVSRVDEIVSRCANVTCGVPFGIPRLSKPGQREHSKVCSVNVTVGVKVADENSHKINFPPVP